MIFPIGDEQVHGGHKAFFSYLFLILNVVVFLFEMSLPEATLNAFTGYFGATPDEFLHGERLYTLVTSLFLHGGWAHFLGNMLFLWVFADNIEATIGNIRFFVFYLAGGVAATLFHGLINPSSSIPLIGASGAISAVLGAYLVIFPHSKIKVLVLFLFSSFRIPALAFLGIWIINQFVSGYGSLSSVSTESAGIAYWAHIGGFIYGITIGYFARRTYFPVLSREAEEESGYV